MPEFFETRMGHSFYNGTMPKIAKALEKIAEQLEVITVLLHANLAATVKDDADLTTEAKPDGGR